MLVKLCEGLPYIAPRDQPLVVLTGKFVQALVESNQFDAPGYAGISIDGVEISEDLQLFRLQINNTVSITNSKFLGIVDLGYTSTTHNLDFSGSSFLKRLCLTGFSSTQSIFINKSLQSDYNKDRQKLGCYGTTDQSSYISLNFARIDGIVSIKEVKGSRLSAVSARVGQFLEIAESSFQSIDLQGLSGGELDIVNSSVGSPEGCNKSTLNVIRITGAVYLSRASFYCGLIMSGAYVGSGLSLLGTDIASLDLTGTTISGDLEIGPVRTEDGKIRLVRWPTSSKGSEVVPQVILDHASANVLRVALESWPGLDDRKDEQDKVEIKQCILQQPKQKTLLNLFYSTLSAFWDWVRFGTPTNSYSRFVVSDFQFKAFGLPTNCRTGDSISDTIFVETNLNVNIGAVETWLTAAQFSPSEFDWVQRLLLSSGDANHARRIAYLKSSITEGLSWNQIVTWPIAISQAASRLLIGYGYCLYASAIWAFLLLALGSWIFSRIPAACILDKKYGLPGQFKDVSAFAYSFDMLLPVIKLREKHYELEIGGWQRQYFYFHKIMGYVIGLFIVGGLTGLTH